MTKNKPKIFSLAAVSLLASGISVADQTTVTEMEVPVVKCNGPVATVTITEIKCTASSCQQADQLNKTKGGLGALAALAAAQNGVQGIGGGVKTMLTNAVQATGCFKIFDLERFKKMKEMLEATGQEVTPPTIDYIINGEITSVEASRSGGALGGGVIPVVGLISTTKDAAKMAMDVTVMSPATLEVASAKSFNADSSKSSFGFAGFGAGGGAGVGGGWSISKSVALDAVAREVVFSVANYLAETYAGPHIVSRPVIAAETKPAAREVSGSGPSTTTGDFSMDY